MIDPELMEHEYQVEEPIGDFDMSNANDIDFEEDIAEGGVMENPIVESTHFDLEVVAKLYTSYGLMNRLLFISDVCPPLRFDALRLLIEYITQNTQNVPMYMVAYQKVEKSKQLGDREGVEKIPPLDNAWVDSISSKAQSQLESHLAEFKRQKDEAVKESIRRSLNEVFYQHVQMGNIQEALKLYGRGMREYCTAPNYVLQMLISWINVTIYANQWQKLSLLIPQAERAISEVVDRESIQSSSGSTIRTANSFVATNVPSKNYKELVQSSKAKIAAVSGLAKMNDRLYKQAAEKFITVDIDALDYPQLLSASDVALYGTLCALATFSRVELKERVLGSTLFRKFLESEPKLVELLQKFCRSEFGICLDIINELQDQLLLNMFLAPHLQQIQLLIRRSSVIQYFQPYLSANMFHMAEVFRTSLDEMERELIDLIEKGLLNARIDSYGKILHAKFSDNRVEIYKRVITLHKRLNERVCAMLFRSALQNHKVGVGFYEKNARRRRGNNINSFVDNAIDSESNFFDPETSGTNTTNVPTSSSSSGPGRIFQRIMSAASRIHAPSTSTTGRDREPVDIATFVNGQVSNGGPVNGTANAELIPSVPSTSGSSNSQQIFTTKSSTSRTNTGGGVANSDMELDENFGDL